MMTIWHSKQFWWCSGLEFNCKCYFFYLLVWTCTAVQRWGRLLLKWHNKRTVCPILKIKRPTETKKIVLSNSISNICKGFILKSYFWKKHWKLSCARWTITHLFYKQYLRKYCSYNKKPNHTWMRKGFFFQMIP